jgi:TPR repeat protein
MKWLIASLLAISSVVTLAATGAVDAQSLIQRAYAGDAKAQFDLGLSYAKGEGVTKNSAEALRWLRKSADQGYDYAEFLLGVCYANGDLVPQSDAEAARWFRKAALKGNADAQHNLGTMNANGIGMPKSKVQAYKWFSLAAAQGNEFAISEKAKLETVMSPSELADAKRVVAESQARTPK